MAYFFQNFIHLVHRLTRQFYKLIVLFSLSNVVKNLGASVYEKWSRHQVMGSLCDGFRIGSECLF